MVFDLFNIHLLLILVIKTLLKYQCLLTPTFFLLRQTAMVLCVSSKSSHLTYRKHCVVSRLIVVEKLITGRMYYAFAEL